MPEERVIFRGTIVEGRLEGADVLVVGPILPPQPWPPPPGCTMGGTEICDGQPVRVRIRSGGIDREVELVIRGLER